MPIGFYFLMSLFCLLLVSCNDSGGGPVDSENRFNTNKFESPITLRNTDQPITPDIETTPITSQNKTRFIRLNFVGNIGEFNLTTGVEKIAELLLQQHLGLELIILQPNLCQPTEGLAIPGTRRLAIEDLALKTAQITYAYEINQSLVDSMSSGTNQAEQTRYETLRKSLIPLTKCAWSWNYKLAYEAQKAIEHNWQILATRIPESHPNLEIPSEYNLVPIWSFSNYSNTPTLYFTNQSLTLFYHYVLVAEFFRDFRYSSPPWMNGPGSRESIQRIPIEVSQTNSKTTILTESEQTKLLVSLAITSEPLLIFDRNWENALGGVVDTINNWRIGLEEILLLDQQDPTAGAGL